jgi:hypothetical protein
LSAVDRRGALEAVERILNRGGEPRQVLAEVLEALRARGMAYGAVRYGGDTVETGVPGRSTISKPIVARGAEVGSLTLAADDEAFVERVAVLVSPYVPPAGP